VAILEGIEVLTPWRLIDDGPNGADRLSARLQSQIPEEHVLHGLRLRAVATLAIPPNRKLNRQLSLLHGLGGRECVRICNAVILPISSKTLRLTGIDCGAMLSV
jgi:hypothetical protein